MNKTNMNKNARDVMTGMCRSFPKFDGEAITILLDNGTAVSVIGANRPGNARMSVTARRGGEVLENIDYLFASDEVVRIAKTLCRKYASDPLISEALLFTDDADRWQNLVTKGGAADLSREGAIVFIDDDPDDVLVA